MSIRPAGTERKVQCFRITVEYQNRLENKLCLRGLYPEGISSLLSSLVFPCNIFLLSGLYREALKGIVSPNRLSGFHACALAYSQIALVLRLLLRHGYAQEIPLIHKQALSGVGEVLAKMEKGIQNKYRPAENARHVFVLHVMFNLKMHALEINASRSGIFVTILHELGQAMRQWARLRLQHLLANTGFGQRDAGADLARTIARRALRDVAAQELLFPRFRSLTSVGNTLVDGSPLEEVFTVIYQSDFARARPNS